MYVLLQKVIVLQIWRTFFSCIKDISLCYDTNIHLWSVDTNIVHRILSFAFAISTTEAISTLDQDKYLHNYTINMAIQLSAHNQ